MVSSIIIKNVDQDKNSEKDLDLGAVVDEYKIFYVTINLKDTFTSEDSSFVTVTGSKKVRSAYQGCRYVHHSVQC